MPSPAVRRLGLVLGGTALGLVAILMGLWFYVQAARVDEVRTGIGERLRLAREAVERIDVIAQDAVRFDLRDAAIIGAAGDTIFDIPRLRLTLDVTSLDGEGAIEFYDVELIDPVARLIQAPDGEWNYLQAFEVQAGGQPVQGGEGRPLLFRDVRITDGSLVLSIPGVAPPEEEGRFAANIPYATIGGLPYQVYRATDVQARLAAVRIGGSDGWRAEIAGATAQILEPNLRIAQLQGVFEQEGEDGVRLDVGELRFGESTIAGRGLVRFTEPGILYDVQVRADPLRLADLQPLFPNLEDEGTARFALDIESLNPERLALAFTELDVAAYDSRILGSLSVAIGGEVPLALLDADLELAPVRISALEQLGLVEESPLLGDISGTITSRDAAAGTATVDLRARVVPRSEPAMLPSIILASGNVSVGSAFDALRLDGLDLGFRPLYLATLRDLLPEQEQRLRGEVEGTIALAGTTTDLRFVDGFLTYDVGDAPTTRLAGVSGSISLQPGLEYDIRATAEPLALGTLTELFPGLPFRSASLTGPLGIAGDTAGVRVTGDLSGPAGGIRFGGSLAFGEPAVFEVEGSLTAFAAGMVLRPELPTEGPLNGTFAVRGTSDRFDFTVDLNQPEGRFALSGFVAPAFEPPRFEASGQVSGFRIGAVVGDPMLFPDPMSGYLSVAGGGGDPYRFDIDLGGGAGRLDLAGFYQPGDVPTYEANGLVAGLDLARLPTPVRLPPSSISARVDIRGSGTTLETLEGSFAFDGTDSSLSGLPLDVALARFDVRDGVMYIDTMHVQLERTRFTASGTWGLLSPTPEPLRFTLDSPDLGVIRRALAPTELVPPQLAGSLTAEGTVAGSVENPIIDAVLSGRNLRYAEYRATTLAADIDALRHPTFGWQGSLSLAGDDLFAPQFQTIQSVRLTASGTQQSFAFSVAARRDPRTDLAAAGYLELDGVVPRGVALEDLTLRLDQAEWDLLAPARISFARVDGLFVENLVLERSGPTPGTITVNGAIPPEGVADLVVATRDFDLSDIRRVSPTAPDMQGLLTLDAVLGGPVSSPEISVIGRIDGLAYQGVTTETVTFDAEYSGTVLDGGAEATAAGQRLFTAEFAMPMQIAIQGMAPAFAFLMDDPLAMTIRADSLPLDLVAALTPGLSEGAGVVRAQIDVGGTIDVPALSGSISLAGGALRIEPLSVRYTDINAELALAQNRILINTFNARSEGTLIASGAVDFPPDSPPVLAVSAGLEEFRVMNDPEVARLTASAQVALNGPITAPVLTGWADIMDSTLQVPELAQEDPTLELAYLDVGQLAPLPGEEIQVRPPLFANLTVDGLDLTVAEGVWLESNEMRVQITGDLVVYRVGEDLRIFGALEAVRGAYALEIGGIVREFDVIRGRVQFFGTGDINPSLDILAGYRVRGTTIGRSGELTILVQLTGTVLSPRVQLGSDTTVPLAESDLISYLLFGRQNFELGGLQAGFAEQLLVQEVVGNFLASELQRPILRAGLCDWVRVRPGVTTSFQSVLGGAPFTGAAIECGWELTSELSVTAQTSLGILGGEFNEGQIGLEWQIDREWMWDASFGSVPRNPLIRFFDASRQQQFSTDIRRQWEYGRPSQRSTIDLLPEEPETPPPPGLPVSPVLEPQGARREEEPRAVARSSP